jgi:hypothetical protein
MSGAQPARSHLRVVDIDTGEALEEHPEIQGLLDEIAGLKRSLAAESRRYAELKRDKEEEARNSQLWPTAVRIFQAWQKATGHSRMAFDYKRFELVAPHLKRKGHGPEYCLAAVAGRVYDHYSSTRKNGTVIHYWEWERIFENIGSLEESARRVPRDWREREPFAQALDSIKLLTA